MSEKIEFIPAKDLPVAEGDEVDVLCVENGELKRKEGASLGGETLDIVIQAMYGIVHGVSGYSVYDPVLASGDYNAICEKVKAGNKINGIVRYIDTSDYGAPYVASVVYIGWTNDEYNLTVSAYSPGNVNERFFIGQDGTVTL